MKILSVSTFLIAFSLSSFAQWQQMNNGGANGDFDGIYFFDNQTGICSGGFAGVQKTTDGGENWSEVSTYGIRDFSFVDNNIGYGASIVGQSMSKTTDGGETWTSITPPTSNSLWGVAAISSTTARFVGTGGKYWYTLDGGASVNSGNSGTIDLLTDIAFPTATTGFIVVEAGEVKKTTNGGQTWSTIYSAPNIFKEMCFLDENIGFVVGTNGEVHKTSDGGDNWTVQSTDGSTYLRGVNFFDADHGLVVGNGGQIFYTADGGDNWSPSNSNVTVNLNDVIMLSATTGIAIGDDGTILKNSNLEVASLNEEENVLVNVFPNPVEEELNITSSEVIENIEITDVNGATVYKSNEDLILNAKIEVGSFLPGIYFVKVKSSTGLVTRKFVK